MSLSRKFITLSVAGLLASVSLGAAEARPRHHARLRKHDRQYAFQQGRDSVGAAAGTALGLLGAGIAGATTVSPGFGYGYTPGYGYYGSGYYGPGFAYPGY